MKKLILWALPLLLLSCVKNENPSQNQEIAKLEAVAGFSFNDESRDIYEMAYRASEDDVMFVFKGESESVFQLGLKSPFVGMMNNVEDIYHNDDYLFYFEDKEYLFTQYHALKSGCIYVSKLDGEDNWDIKLDLILPEGSSFAFSYQGRIRNSE